MVWVPPRSALVARVATPFAPTALAPRVVAPSLNVTEPVGIPLLVAPAVTVAVNVTLAG